MAKSSVSALHEFCAKNKLIDPVFEFIETEGGFTCRVMIGNIYEDGTGRSKRDAKHLATANILKKLCIDTPTVVQAELPTTDTYAALRDFCIQNDYPLPTVEIVQQGGTPDAPVFLAKCTVASIQRFGESEKKKDAKQIAALALLSAISHSYIPDMKMQLVPSIDSKAADAECERRLKFRSYRELAGLKNNEYVPVKLTDRHMYFCKYKPELKEAALKIIYSNDYDNYESQATALFKALKINIKITDLKAEKTCQKFLFIELDCDYDACFGGHDPEVYKDIVEYFKIMLV